MAVVTSQASSAFLERAGLRRGRKFQRSPVLDATALRAPLQPLRPPRPLPELVVIDNGNPPPDRTETKDWPWPVDPDTP
jgi:hypothetical protein